MVPTRVGISPDLIPALVVLARAVLLIIITKALNPGAGVSQQISAILVTSIFLVVASFGHGLTILLGGIDLSIGVVIGLSAMMISVLTNGSDGALPWALPTTLLSCAGIGLINGIGIALGKAPPFIMTLASGISFFGVGQGFTSGLAQEPVAPALQGLMSGRWLGLPIPIYLIAFFLALASLFRTAPRKGASCMRLAATPCHWFANCGADRRSLHHQWVMRGYLWIAASRLFHGGNSRYGKSAVAAHHCCGGDWRRSRRRGVGGFTSARSPVPFS